MSAPLWTWTDMFGDTLEVRDAGKGLVLSIAVAKGPTTSDDACILLDLEMLRGLRAALGVHLRGDS